MLFDTHNHLNSSDFDGERDSYVQMAVRQGVAGLCIIGSDEGTLERGFAMLNDYPQVVMICGAHPVEAKDLTPERWEAFEKAWQHPKVVGVGEIGLDYHWPDSPPKVQKEVFVKQLAVARRLGLPFAIHTRDSLEDTYAILKEEQAGDIGGVIHSFGYDLDWAKKFLDLGLYLSFSGVATFKKSKAVREAAAYAPLDRILIETDSPYLTPEPFRGKVNHPALVRFVNDRLAYERGLSYEEFAKATYENACRFYGLQEVAGGFQRASAHD